MLLFTVFLRQCDQREISNNDLMFCSSLDINGYESDFIHQLPYIDICNYCHGKTSSVQFGLI